MTTDLAINQKSRAYPPHMLRELVLEFFVTLELEPKTEKKIELANNFMNSITSMEKTRDMDQYTLAEVEKRKLFLQEKRIRKKINHNQDFNIKELYVHIQEGFKKNYCLPQK